ncbi:hypothetical protein EV645_2875 [Kribbella rubisoli]|uniref:Uncharacterized protein n=1 Tax=Kribbella rubisoli TaxID=3075929 RepID=A0A4Q7XBT3_9ACTN|nr:hypothetical protein EV645_2875 [Kribbella rubisoli]
MSPRAVDKRARPGNERHPVVRLESPPSWINSLEHEPGRKTPERRANEAVAATRPR